MDDRLTTPRVPIISSSRTFSRRSVVRTAAWTVPVITVATAAPAFAASTPITLTASYNPDSFRANSNAELTSGTPSAGQLAPIAMSVAVAGGALANLTCTLTSGGVSVANNSVSPARGTTTWAVNGGDLAANGFTSTPAIGGAQNATVTFVKSTPTAAGTSALLKFVIGSIGGGDFPLVFTFTSTSTTASATVTVTSPAATPFLAGAVS